MFNRSMRIIALLLLPSLLVTALFYLIPAAMTAVMSLTDMDFRLKWNFIGLGNFLRMTQDFLLPRILKNTVVYTFLTLILFNVGFSVVLALTTSLVGERAGRIFQSLWLLPRFTPPIVYGIIWMWILDPTKNGLLNSLLVAAGGKPINWIAEYPMATIVLTNGLIGVSFGMVIFYSAIESIPKQYLWAAEVDGASWLHLVRYITLPLIRWPLLFVTAYQTLSLLTSYEYILIITQGGPYFATTVWSLYAYNLAFGGYFANYEFGYGAALSIVLVILGIVASIVYWRVFRFKDMMGKPKIEVM